MFKSWVEAICSWFSKPKQKADFFDNVPREDADYLGLKKSREFELDRLLIKLQKHGYESLTKKEVEFLKKMKTP
ncbi:MAG: DUF6576 domain-containing protein [Flavobacteriales bacterium]